MEIASGRVRMGEVNTGFAGAHGAGDADVGVDVDGV